jgi:hypothetical protein
MLETKETLCKIYHVVIPVKAGIQFQTVSA